MVIADSDEFDLGLDVQRSGDWVKAYRDGEEVASFYYYESARNVYKKQDFRSLLRLINEKVSQVKKEYGWKGVGVSDVAVLNLQRAGISVDEYLSAYEKVKDKDEFKAIVKSFYGDTLKVFIERILEMADPDILIEIVLMLRENPSFLFLILSEGNVRILEELYKEVADERGRRIFMYIVGLYRLGHRRLIEDSLDALVDLVRFLKGAGFEGTERIDDIRNTLERVLDKEISLRNFRDILLDLKVSGVPLTDENMLEAIKGTGIRER